MAGKTKYLLRRDGRYFALIVVPADLRPYLENKTELRTPLGADRREALRKHPIAVGDLMHKIALAERRAADAQGIPQVPGRFPMTDAQLATRSYQDRLEQDAKGRVIHPGYARLNIDDGYASMLRVGMAGAASDAELHELVGHRIEYYRKIGNTTVAQGTHEWRSLVMALCASEYEALSRVAERDEGDYTGTPAHPMIRDAKPVEDELPPIPLRALFRDYLIHLREMKRAGTTLKKWGGIFENLCDHLGHDDARRITRQDMMAWRDKLLLTRSAKTVGPVYLSAVRAAFNWAVAEDRLPSNPVENVRQNAPKQVRSRSKGFSDNEAQAVLIYSRNHKPKDLDGRIFEAPTMTAAKRWAPIISAHSGARITEVTQLRKQDIRREGHLYVMRITPDAGSVKTGQYRDVPLHPQLIAMGLAEFVDGAADGPLFYVSKDKFGDHDKARQQGNRIATWLRKSGHVPDDVMPNHAWRHRFKKVSRELGLSGRVVDAICGHSSRTAGDDYGDVTVKAKALVIEQMPAYRLEVNHR